MATSKPLCRQAEPAIFSIQPMTRRCQKVFAASKSGGGHVPPKAFAQGWYAPVDT